MVETTRPPLRHADRGLGIGPSDFAELHADIGLARIRVHGFREHGTPILSLGATSSSIACMIEGTPAITITSPIQKPGAPDTWLTTRAVPARRAQARFVHLGAGRLHPFVQDGESARISVDRHPECLGDAAGGDVTMGRPDPASSEDIGAAVPERIECVDNRSLLVADHPHFLEIDAERRQILRNIADVLGL